MMNMEEISLYCKRLPEYVGQVRMWGDDGFDSDSIKIGSTKQIRWLSYPFGRLVLNPNTVECTNKEYLPMQKDLDLIIGYYVGNENVRPFYRKQHCMVSINGVDHTPCVADTVDTVWYPYKIAYSASYSKKGTTLTGYDFFTDPNSIVRAMELKGQSDCSIRLNGIGDGEVRWDTVHEVILISSEDYFYALRIASMDEGFRANGLDGIPVINGREWSVQCASRKVALGYGFSTRQEGSLAAVQRAAACFKHPIHEQLRKTKEFWDKTLRQIPVPARWGITAVDPGQITPEQHRNRYYAAWTFLISNMLVETPERGFNYRQVTVGKAALWTDGSALCPSNCAWESFFEIQMLALLYPETAWSATEGFMAMIDEDGWLEGECLPSQKAHTAWVVHSIAPDLRRLEAIYPAIKRYLLWREKNPYWIWSPGGPQKPENPSDLKDISFVSQWLQDIDYAVMICDELGYSEDAEMWKQHKSEMIDHVRQWFFTEDGIFGVYWADSGKHDDNALFTIDMLVNTLSPEMDSKLKDYYLKIHDGSRDLAGLSWSKYGNIYYAIMGLYDKKLTKQANELSDAIIKHMLLVRDFCEVETRDVYEVDGVNPSAFSACQIIGLTWMRNGMRYEKGEPYAMEV